MSKQLDLKGLPQAIYPIRIYCQKCGRTVELKVGVDVLHDLGRLRCSGCGARRPNLKVDLLGVDLGG